MSQESPSLSKGSIGTESYCVYPDLASEHLVFMGPPTREDLKLFVYVTSFSPHNKLNVLTSHFTRIMGLVRQLRRVGIQI